MSAQERYEQAMRRIKTGLTVRQGAMAAENQAAQAYRELVRDGQAPPLRSRWRNGKHHKQVK